MQAPDPESQAPPIQDHRLPRIPSQGHVSQHKTLRIVKAKAADKVKSIAANQLHKKNYCCGAFGSSLVIRFVLLYDH